MKKNQRSNKKTIYKPSPEARERYPDAEGWWIEEEECAACGADIFDPCVDKRGRKLGEGRYHRARIDAANREMGIEELRREFDNALIEGEEALKARLSWSKKDGPSIRKYGTTERGMGLEHILVRFPVREMVYEICEDPERRALLFEYLALEASTQKKIDDAERLRS